MKLPATLLAVLGLSGCETPVDFAHRSGPEPARAPVAEKGRVEKVQIEMPRTFAQPPPAATTSAKPIATPGPNTCGPCGMG